MLTEKTKRGSGLLAVFLCAAMLLGMGGLFGLSPATEATGTYSKYFSLGTSVTCGVGLNDGEKAYPEIIAEKLGIERSLPGPHAGLRTNEALAFLGIETYAEANCGYPEYYENINDFSTEEIQKHQNALKDAELITVELGVCDVEWYSARMAFQCLNEQYQGQLSAEAAIQVAKTSVQSALEGYESFKVNYPHLIEEMMKMKEGTGEYTMVLVGSINLLHDIVLSEEYPIPIGNIFDEYAEMVNEVIRDTADKFGLAYVDVSAAEIGGVRDNQGLLYTDDSGNISYVFSNDIVGARATHPTATGQKYIAERILEALEGKSSISGGATIALPVEEGTKVTAVRVNGENTSAYTFDEDKRILTLSSDCIGTSKLVTVLTERPSGKTQLLTYFVRKSADQEYTAKMLYTTSDLLGTLKGSLKGITSVLQKLKNLLPTVSNITQG